MKHIRRVVLVFICAMVLISCNNDSEDDGTLVIKNRCAAKDSIYVTDVYVGEKDDVIFTHEYSCKIAPGDSWSVDLEPGKYWVGIRTRSLIGNIYAIHYYMRTTGLNNYQELRENGYLVVECDKVGVRFE